MWYNAYLTQFRDDDGGLWTVAIQTQNPVATETPITLTPGKKPLEWDGKANGEQGEVFLPTTGTLRLWITSETIGELAIGKLLPSKHNERRVIVSRNNVVAWQGFLLPETYDQDWVSPDFEIELSVCDTISSLSYIYMDGTDTSENIIQLLYSAYQRVGGELSIGDFLISDRQLYYARNGAPTSRRVHWGSGGFYPAYFSPAEDEDKKSYRDVIEILLSPYGRIRQIGQRWYVGTENAVPGSMYKPNPNGLGRLDGGRMAVMVVDMEGEEGGTKNTQSILPPPSKVTLKYEPEKGNLDYSGDELFKADSDVITSPYSASFRDMSELRYLDVSAGNLRWPLRLFRHTMCLPATFQDGRIVMSHFDARIEDRAVWDCTGFSQALRNNEGSWEVEKGLVFGQRRLIRDETASSFTLDVSVDEFRLEKEVQTSESFRLKLLMKSQLADLKTRDYWSDGSAINHEEQPYVQIYYGETPGAKTQLLTRNLLDGGWTWGPAIDNIWIAPSFEQIPVKDFENGCNLRIPNDRGYLTFVVFAGHTGLSGCEKDVAFHGDNRWKIDCHSILSAFELSYSENTSSGQSLLEWNKDATSTIITKTPGGTEEIELSFKTLANEDPTAETYLAPRRGFCDSKDAFIASPRQLLDIGALKLKNYDLAGVAHPAIFRFDGEPYFPLSVGMDCARNRAKLKLIKTL